MKLKKLIDKLMGIENPKTYRELEKLGFVETGEIDSENYTVLKRNCVKVLYDRKNDEVVKWYQKK